MSDKVTMEQFQKIQTRFLDCLEQGISIEEPMQNLMKHDMHTVLDLCFGPQAIQEENFYVAIRPFFQNIEEFLPNNTLKIDKRYEYFLTQFEWKNQQLNKQLKFSIQPDPGSRIQDPGSWMLNLNCLLSC